MAAKFGFDNVTVTASRVGYEVTNEGILITRCPGDSDPTGGNVGNVSLSFNNDDTGVAIMEPGRQLPLDCTGRDLLYIKGTAGDTVNFKPIK